MSKSKNRKHKQTNNQSYIKKQQPKYNKHSCEKNTKLQQHIENQHTNERKTLLGTIKSIFLPNNTENDTDSKNSSWWPTWLKSNNKPIITKLSTSTEADVYIPPNNTMKVTSRTTSYPYYLDTDTIYSASPPITTISRSNSASSTSSNGKTNKSGRKQRIPKTIRRDVWEKVHGEHNAKGKCYVKWCPRILDKMEFQAGHNIPESKGGTIQLDNLFPICGECNQGMGDRYTIDEWSNMDFVYQIREDFKDHMSINEYNKAIDIARYIVSKNPHLFTDLYIS